MEKSELGQRWSEYIRKVFNDERGDIKYYQNSEEGLSYGTNNRTNHYSLHYQKLMEEWSAISTIFRVT